MECCRCGHLAASNGSNSGVELMETPCSHIYCEKCVHRYVSYEVYAIDISDYFLFSREFPVQFAGDRCSDMS